jgi:hypothetical protein
MVTWPEIQEYMNNPRWNECILCQNIEGHECPDSAYMIPEDIYFCKPEFTVKRGDKVLLQDLKTGELIETVALSNDYEDLPIIFENNKYLEGINCKIIKVL